MKKQLEDALKNANPELIAYVGTLEKITDKFVAHLNAQFNVNVQHNINLTLPLPYACEETIYLNPMMFIKFFNNFSKDHFISVIAGTLHEFGHAFSYTNSIINSYRHKFLAQMHEQLFIGIACNIDRNYLCVLFEEYIADLFMCTYMQRGSFTYGNELINLNEFSTVEFLKKRISNNSSKEVDRFLYVPGAMAIQKKNLELQPLEMDHLIDDDSFQDFCNTCIAFFDEKLSLRFDFSKSYVMLTTD